MALKNFCPDLELSLKELFAGLHIYSHLTGAGIRQCEGFSLRHRRKIHYVYDRSLV